MRTDYDWLTRDERYVDRFLNNPRCDFIFTVGAYRDFFHEIRGAEEAEMVGYMPTVIPYLILSGDKDPVGGEWERREKACRPVSKGRRAGYHNEAVSRCAP